MPSYYDIKNNIYPLHIGDLQLIVSNWKEGDSLPDGIVFVQDTDIPTVLENQTVNITNPEFIDGVWKQKYLIRNLTQEEIDKKNIGTLESVFSPNVYPRNI